MNFTEEAQQVMLTTGLQYSDMLTGEVYGGQLDLAPYAAFVLKLVRLEP
jgi:beta-galactosidase GanA